MSAAAARVAWLNGIEVADMMAPQPGNRCDSEKRRHTVDQIARYLTGF
jgi:hypothetical protein